MKFQIIQSLMHFMSKGILGKIKSKEPAYRLFLGGALFVLFNAHANSEFRPGETWRDSDGNSIQAHGGGVLAFKDAFYWYGEDRTPGIRSAVACYSSHNLLDWKREGVALWQTNLPTGNGRRTFAEQPKVIYNQHTKQFVMWMHLDEDQYFFAHAGIAVSGAPAGPFTFVKALCPITNTNQFTTKDSDPTQQNRLGGTAMSEPVDWRRALPFGYAEALLLAAVRDLMPVEMLHPERNGSLWHRIRRRLDLTRAFAAGDALVRNVVMTEPGSALAFA